MKLTPLDPWIAKKIGQNGRPVNRDAIDAYQLEKIQETIEQARIKSVFYREHLAGAPQYLADLETLHQFPFTTAADISSNPLLFLCVSQGQIQRVVSLFSSGTTGRPKRLFFTQADQELTLDFFHVGMSTLVEPGDRVMILLPCATPGGVGDLLAHSLERMDVSCVRHGPVQSVSETLQVMLDEQVNSLVGIPMQVLALARFKAQNGQPPPIKLKSALLTTDYVPPSTVNTVETAWSCRIYNHYGMTEMGLGGGVECQARRGYHVREADLYFEIVHPLTNQPVPEGDEGEIVFTTLTRQGMPLVRYRTGDLGRFIPGPCPCGTALKTLSRVRQRIDGCIPLSIGSYFSMADLDDALLALNAVWNFNATFSESNSGGRLDLDVQVLPGHEGCDEMILKAMGSIPAIYEAKKASLIETTVKTDSVSQYPSPDPAKRSIKVRAATDT